MDPCPAQIRQSPSLIIDNLHSPTGLVGRTQTQIYHLSSISPLDLDLNSPMLGPWPMLDLNTNPSILTGPDLDPIKYGPNLAP